MIRFRWLVLLCLLQFFTNTSQAQYVPDKLGFCDVEIHLTPGARNQISKYLKDIYKNTIYFNAMVKRAEIFMPFVAEAFADEEVPNDLIYMVIQESGLQADAISTSNAVGFWQFKEATAREVGLIVNDQIDERMHIYRSSKAAATYLASNNLDFDNWLYAMIAYKEGRTGAVPYTDIGLYGKRLMILTEKFHWYVLKAIAHKLAYEKPLNMRDQPEVFLKPYATVGGIKVKELYESHNVSMEDFFEYNRWIVNTDRLPLSGKFTYYIPSSDIFYPGHKEDPIKKIDNVAQVNTNPEAESYTSSSSLGKPQSVQAKPLIGPRRMAPVARDYSELSHMAYADFDIHNDLHYGQEFAYFDGSQTIEELASSLGVNPYDLMSWNGLTPGIDPSSGKIIYLKPAEQVLFHIVENGEDLARIAEMHGTTMSRVKKLNRMYDSEFLIYVGQKLYLRTRRPDNEKKIILLDEVEKPETRKQVQLKPEPKKETPAPVITLAIKKQKEETSSEKEIKSDTSKPLSGESRWVDHIVTQGETLYSIAKNYNTTMEVVKMTNKLEDGTVNVGQVLRILAHK